MGESEPDVYHGEKLDAMRWIVGGEGGSSVVCEGRLEVRGKTTRMNERRDGESSDQKYGVMPSLLSSRYLPSTPLAYPTLYLSNPPIFQDTLKPSKSVRTLSRLELNPESKHKLMYFH